MTQAFREADVTDVNKGRCNCSALRRAARRVSLMYDRHLTGSGLTSGQYSILAEIRRRGKVAPTVSELAEALVMDRAALTHTLKPLERDGLIAVKVDSADRRARLVHVTGLGERKFAVAHGKWSKAQEQFAQSVGKKKAVALRALLQLVGEIDLGEMN